MQTQIGVHLHCGHVDIGHVHRALRQRTFAHPVQARYCQLSEGSRSALFGRTVGLKAGQTCGRNIRHVKQRLAVQTSAIFGFLRGDAAEKTRKKYQAQVDAINRLEPQMEKLSDEELAKKTQDLKQKAQRNGGVDDLLVEAFAVGLVAVFMHASKHIEPVLQYWFPTSVAPVVAHFKNALGQQLALILLPAVRRAGRA